jgi:alcohol dehydrogenase (NADP+)
MAQDYKFEGWLGHDKDSVKGNMVWGEFEPKPWEETDVDIEVTHCGICVRCMHEICGVYQLEGSADLLPGN